ncbi:putative urease accessory protein ureD-like, partial [Clarias magur]
VRTRIWLNDLESRERAGPESDKQWDTVLKAHPSVAGACCEGNTKLYEQCPGSRVSSARLSGESMLEKKNIEPASTEGVFHW